MTGVFLKINKKLIPWKCILILLLVLYVLCSNQLCYAHIVGETTTDTINTNEASSIEFFVSVLSVTVAALGILATIAIAVTTIINFKQKRDVEEERQRFSEIVDEAEKQIAALKESVKVFEPPPEILKKAKEKAEKISEYGDNALRSYINVLEEHLKEKLAILEHSVKSGESTFDEISATLNSIKNEIEKKPSINEILVKVADKYKGHQDLSAIILQKVGLAFVCLRNLSDEERKEIMVRLDVDKKDGSQESKD